MLAPYLLGYEHARYMSPQMAGFIIPIDCNSNACTVHNYRTVFEYLDTHLDSSVTAWHVLLNSASIATTPALRGRIATLVL